MIYIISTHAINDYYLDNSEIKINPVQTQIMVFIKKWANTEKIPIPHKKILEYMTRQKTKVHIILWSIGILIKKGYIRRAYTENQKNTSYVMIRNI